VIGSAEAQERIAILQGASHEYAEIFSSQIAAKKKKIEITDSNPNDSVCEHIID
jgi:hypothetical protein